MADKEFNVLEPRLFDELSQSKATESTKKPSKSKQSKYSSCYSPQVTERLSRLKTVVDAFPQTPGVYRMYDTEKAIIYIGKAKDLKKRVTSYFTKQHDRLITEILMSKVVDIDYIVAASEMDALILENVLIKKHLPFFNIDLKDDKSFPYLFLTSQGGYPRLLKVRNPGSQFREKGELFGPYTNVKLLNVYLDLVNTLFPLKKCKTTSFPKGFKPCLYFHIGKCLDYCTGGVDQRVIDDMMQEIKALMGGNRKELVAILSEKLEQEKSKLNYERARDLKHYLDILSAMDYRSRYLISNGKNFDVINYTYGQGVMVLVVLSFRDGKLVDKNSYDYVNEIYDTELNFDWLVEEVLPQFLFDYYIRLSESVREVYLPLLISKSRNEREILTDLQTVMNKAIAQRRTDNEYAKLPTPEIRFGWRGEKLKYLNLAKANARYSSELVLRKQEQQNYAKIIKSFLKLSRIPRVVESFDVANTADKKIIAGMVRFVDGEKDKSNYRIFNIKTTDTQNDFRSIEEAVFRRYRRLLEEGLDFPDLIMIDGGKGQLSSAKKSLTRLRVKGQPIISIAKQQEKIYVPKMSYPIVIPHDNLGLRYLITVRDETHRFVNSTHVRLRDKDELKSILFRVRGLGAKKVSILQSRFESLEAIALSDKDAITALPYFTEKDADLLIAFLKSRELTKSDNQEIDQRNQSMEVKEISENHTD